MNSSKKPIRFLIADDHSIVRQGMVLMIEDSFEDYTVVQTSTLAETKKVFETEKIDIAILDIQFQDGNCIELFPEIKKHPDTKILIFSSCDEKTHALKYLEAGANGYLNKLSDEENISLALQSMVKNGSYISNTVQQLLIKKMVNPHFDQPLHSLTERELEIAKLYAEGLGNLEISNKLAIKQSTVSTLKKRIFEKLEISNIVELMAMLKS